MDLTVTDTADLTWLFVRKTNALYQPIRVRMAYASAAQSPFENELETD
jgi:hypothetical protein